MKGKVSLIARCDWMERYQSWSLRYVCACGEHAEADAGYGLVTVSFRRFLESTEQWLRLLADLVSGLCAGGYTLRNTNPGTRPRYNNNL